MKSYTDIKQSKKLAEFLSLESADMCYLREDGKAKTMSPSEISEILNVSKPQVIPCWSLAALMDILDRGALFITPQGWACQSYINFKAITSSYYDNPVDSCYEMIIKLHEQKLL